MDDLDAQALFESLPFAQRLGIELESAGDGRAVATMELEDHHSSVPWTTVAHGGVTYSLADTVGGSAVFTLHPKPTPTIDMRIDYLSPATESLRAEAEVIRDGGSVAVVSVDVTNAAGEPLAEARGVYKTDGGEGETAWSGGADFPGYPTDGDE
jgi:uncharacterized protein (TIGR00369 family)